MKSMSLVRWLMGFLMMSAVVWAADGNSSSGGIPVPIFPPQKDVPAEWRGFNYLEVQRPIEIPGGASEVSLPGPGNCSLKLAMPPDKALRLDEGTKLGIGSVSWETSQAVVRGGPFPRTAPAPRPGPAMPMIPPPHKIVGVRFVLTPSEISLVCPWTESTPIGELHSRLAPFFLPHVTPMPSATHDNVHEARGAADPAAMTLADGRLYVAEIFDQKRNAIAVYDVSRAGQEKKIGEIRTPVNPVDVLVADGFLYVIDQRQHDLYYTSLAKLQWERIALGSALDGDFHYGKILHRHGDQLFVVHGRQDVLDVVSLEQKRLERVFSGDGIRPYEIAFHDGAAFVFSDRGAISRIDLKNLMVEKVRPAQSRTNYLEGVASVGSVAYLVSGSQIERYDMESRQVTASLFVRGLSRAAAASSLGLFVTTNSGHLLAISPDLLEVKADYLLLETKQHWYPPLDKVLVELRGMEQRVMVSNLNDGGVSFIDVPSDIRP